MWRKLPAAFLMAMMLYAAGAHADDSAARMFSFSGFGTAGVVHSSQDQADFTSSRFKPGGAGYGGAWSADVDSLIAAQLIANASPKLSAVVQIVSEQNYDNSYRPHLEWANVKYQFTPDFSVRAGRTLLPTFLFSATRKVGYTYPWVRPPLELYGINPVTNIDGVDAAYRLHLGEWVDTLQASGGRTKADLPDNGGVVDARKLLDITDVAESGPLTGYISYMKANATVPSINSFLEAFRQFGPQGAALADRYNFNDKPVTVIGAGGSYDPGNWFAMGEWGRVNTHSALGRRTAWYAGGGYRLGKFTPFVTYAQAKADNLADPGLNLSTIPPAKVRAAVGLNAALDTLLRTKPVQDTLSGGLRWDFMRNVDLKLQFDHIRIGAGSNGVLSDPQPGFHTGGRVDVFSAAIDFVF
jgi:hypothetical protein